MSPNSWSLNNADIMTSTRKELASGVFYTALAKYSNIAAQIVVAAVLARLLTPDDYGLVAVATVYIAFFNLLSDIGIGPAVIQFRDLTRSDLGHIFSFTAWVGAVMAWLFFACAGPIASYYDNPQLEPVCRLLSLTILFYCLNIVPQNLQYKRKRFKFTGFTTLSVYVLSATLAIVLALMGWGVWALVTQQVMSAFLLFLIYYLQDRLPFRPRIDFRPLRRIMSFSLFQFLFNIINYFSRNLDKLLIGRYIGLAPLGQYEKSYRLMLMPLQNITFAVTPVLQPVLSKFQDSPREIADKYIKLFHFLCYIGFPLSVLLFFTGGELILLFFGDQWHDAVFPFRILALTVGLQILNGTSGSVYQSANATRQLFISGCWGAFFMVTAFAVTIFGWGTINAVAVGYAIAQLFNSAQTYWLLFRTLQFPLHRALIGMVYPLFVSLSMGLVLWLFLPLLSGLPTLLSLAAKCLTALITWYLLVNYAGPNRGEINAFFRRLFQKQSNSQNSKCIR